MVRDPDMSDPVDAAASDAGEALFDEHGTQYYLAEDGSAYYLDEDGKPYYIAEDGNAYYFAEAGEEAGEAASAAEEAPAAAKPRDPIARFLSIAVVLVVVVLLVGAGTMIWWLLQMRGAPRTAAEHEIYTFETATSEKPKDEENWLRLSYAYMDAGRWGDANDAIDKGRKLKPSTAFDLAAADLLRRREKYPEAIQAYTTAQAAEVKNLDRIRKEAAEKSITMPPDYNRLIEILMGRGMAYEAVGKTEEALKDFSEANEYTPMDVVVLTAIGRTQAKLGHVKEAKEAYTEALKYVPYYAEAKEGLKNLEGK